MSNWNSVKNGSVKALVAVALLSGAQVALAALGASVTLATGSATDIYPGEITTLRITLSNSTTAPLTGTTFSNSLPGTLPNGLKVAGAAVYSCTYAGGNFPTAGSVTATLGAQSIALTGGTVPAKSGAVDGTCVIDIPVTAGTSAGAAATYTYTFASGAVTGNDGAAQANSGAVNQSVNVKAFAKPSISKNFASSTIYLGGVATTLTITINNNAQAPIANFGLTDNLPANIEIAGNPNASATCPSGTNPSTVMAVAGSSSIAVSGGTLASGGSCTITVDVVGKTTSGGYSLTNTNTINTTDFTNDIGLPAASNATRDITVRSPLGVTKTVVGGGLLSDGGSDSFRIRLSNNGTAALVINSLTDDAIDGSVAGNANTYGLKVGAGGATVSCTAGGTAGTFTTTTNNTGIALATNTTIAAGGTCDITIPFTAGVQTPGLPATYTNSLVAGQVGTATPGVVSQPTSAAVIVADDLRVLKTVSPSSGTGVVAGSAVKYAITVQNYGLAAISNVLVSDPLTAGQSFITGTITGVDYSPVLSGTGCVGLTVGGTATTPTFTIATLPGRSLPTAPASCTVTFYAKTDVGGLVPTNVIPANSVCYNSGAKCNGGASNVVNTTVQANVATVSKAYNKVSPQAEGTIVRATIAVNNWSANPLAIGIADNLPPAVSGGQMYVASPANAVTSCGGSPSITAIAGTTSVAMSGATVPARGSNGTAATAGTCTLQVDVVAGAGVYAGVGHANVAIVSYTEKYMDGSTHTGSANASADFTFSSALCGVGNPCSKTFNPASVSSGGKSTVTIRLGNSGALGLSDVTLADNLPAGMVVANPANAYTTCSGATIVTASPAATSVSLNGAIIAGSGSCDLVFDVRATGVTNWINTIAVGGVTASGGVMNQAPIIGVLNNTAPTTLTVAKATNPSTLTFPGQASQLTITVNNGSVAASGLGFTDYFTVDGTVGAAGNGMVIASTPVASTTCLSGVVMATPGAASVGLSGATLAANATCTVTVNVTSTTVGGITNYIPAGSLQTNQGLTNSGQATTSLTTQSNLGIAKKFTPNVVKPGERSRLRITFFNPTTQPVTDLSVTDTLPVNVTVPGGANPTTTCTGGIVTAPTAGSVQISNATIAAASGGVSASCYVEIDVLVSTAGDYLNTIPANAISAVLGGTPVTNTQPTSDTLRAKSSLVIQKALSNKTLDASPTAPFTTGSDIKSAGTPATMTIRIDNPNATALTQASFTDTLPTNLVVAITPNASTTCASGVVTATASGTSVRLSGATLAANSFCTVSVNVLSNVSGSYTNTIGARGVTTLEGVTNEEPTDAQLIISTPPSVAKQFTPSVIAPSGISRLHIEIGNTNASALTLTSILTDTLPTAPGNILIAAVPNIATTCGAGVGSITAVAGTGTVSLANGSNVAAGGCFIDVDVTGATPGTHTNNIAAAALKTNLGNNQDPANAALTISTLGYVSGKVFKDNNVTPNGTFEPGTDTPISGVSIELRSGATCSGFLVSQVGLTNPVTTDALGNYTFAELAAGTYSACQPSQPSGTTNGTTSAGSIAAVSGSTNTAGTPSNPTATSSQIANIVLGGGTGGAAGTVSGTPNNNFAEVAVSSISGTVFLDQNNNGVQNGADTGISGVTVELLNNANTLVATTTTDGSGNYSFTGLAPGNYAVLEPIQPANTSNGITTAGAVANGGTPGNATAVLTTPSVIGGTTKITLPPNTASTGNNFAEIANGRSISGKVFLDFDNSGTFNGTDYGLPTQTLNLTGSDVNGNPVTRTIVTGADGSYTFASLPESNGTGYTITQPNQPTGTGNGITTVGSTGTTATASTVPVSVISGINLAGANTVSGGNDFAEVPGPSPDLAISKTHSPANFAAGSSTGYFTIKPSNVGSLPTSGTITMVDTLPAGLTVAETPTGPGWNCVGVVGATSFTCTTTAVIASGGTGTPITARVAVASGLEGQILTNTAVISGGGESAGLTGNNTATDPVAVATVAGVRGRVWLDKDHDRKYVAGATDTPQGDWKVELLLNGVLVASTTSAADGTYAFSSLAPGSGYKIQFRHPTTNLIWGRAVPNEQGTNYTSGTTSGTTNGVTGVRSGANPAGATATDGTLSNLTFTSGTTTTEQSLPLDPAGVVYDSITRQPVAGAVVTISGPGGLVPGIHLVGGLSTFTTATDGLYQFLLNPTAPVGVYTLAITTYPGGYAQVPSAVIPVCTNTLAVGAVPAPALVQTNNTAPTNASTMHTAAACVNSTGGLNAINRGSTQYFVSFNMTPGTSADVLNNHIPLDPMSATGFVLSKTGDKRIAEVGDSVRYTIEVRLNSSSVMPQVTVRDRLPAGFTFIPGTAVVNGVPAANPAGGLGPVLGFTVGALRGSSNVGSTAPQVIKIQYRIRVGVGSQQGDGVNRARAIGCSVMAGCLDGALLPIANSVQSNEGLYKVEVTGGVFTDEACVLGKVFVDCNNNHIQDHEELGIPGVRLYFSDGHFVVSDSEGKYSRCGIPPRSHVLTPDPSTLPKGSRLTTSSNRNLGDANSLFLDIKNGELHRADFIEGSCSNAVLEQVKARRTQGEVRSIETEKPDEPALRFISKPLGYPQQGTDSANQPQVQPRQGANDAR